MHYYVTRYGLDNSDPEWYKKRLIFFEKLYAASLKAQSDPNWKSVLLIDESTPKESIIDLEKIIESDDRFLIAKKEEWKYENGKVYTRMDSDDFVAFDFTQRINSHKLQDGQMLNFDSGYLVFGDIAYEKNYKSNMFLSVADARGPYFRQHPVMHKNFKVFTLGRIRMWGHTYHHATITKKIPKNPKKFKKMNFKRFPFLKDSFPEIQPLLLNCLK